MQTRCARAAARGVCMVWLAAVLLRKPKLNLHHYLGHTSMREAGRTRSSGMNTSNGRSHGASCRGGSRRREPAHNHHDIALPARRGAISASSPRHAAAPPSKSSGTESVREHERNLLRHTAAGAHTACRAATAEAGCGYAASRATGCPVLRMNGFPGHLINKIDCETTRV